MRKTALIIACATACCWVAGPAFSQQTAEFPKTTAGKETPAEGKATSAAEIRAMFHEGLIARGIPAPIAALLTAVDYADGDDDFPDVGQTLVRLTTFVAADCE